MSLVTVTLRPLRSLSVALSIGGQAPVTVMEDRMAVLIGARQVIVGPPGASGVVRSLIVQSTPELTPDADMYDQVTVAAQNAAIMINNPSPVSTVSHGRKLLITLEDNGLAQPVAFGSAYRGASAPLPTTTVAGKMMYMGFAYNAVDAKWDLIAFANQL